jgi:hypothetical protein
VPREPEVEDEVELIVQSHGTGLFDVGLRVAKSGGKWDRSDTPFGSGLYTCLANLAAQMAKSLQIQ